MTARLPELVSLVGRFVRCDPIAEDDVPGLASLLLDERQPSGGNIMYPTPRTQDEAEALVRRRYLATGEGMNGKGYGKLAWVVRLTHDTDLGAAGTIVGTSALAEFHLVNESTHIGSTVYGVPWWGTVVNPETKLLLLGYAFDKLGYGRVRIQTDELNTRSRAAIAKLGAVFEGIQRREMAREDGTFRNTAVYSMLGEEWPAIRDGLRARVDAWEARNPGSLL